MIKVHFLIFKNGILQTIITKRTKLIKNDKKFITNYLFTQRTQRNIRCHIFFYYYFSILVYGNKYINLYYIFFLDCKAFSYSKLKILICSWTFLLIMII